MSERPLRAEAPLFEAVRAIEASRRRIAVVADSDGRLMGTLTDGDVRRALLVGHGLDTPVAHAMNTHPIIAEAESPHNYLLDLMRRGNVMSVPLVDAQGKFVRLAHVTDLLPEKLTPTDGFSFAMIMAGGEGKRLRPFTESIPKPMVDIGGVPLLERQIEKLAQAGLRLVYISVNYLSHIIEDHFGGGGRFGLEIRYVREREKMGTAGALSLLPERPEGPILVMNGDIITTSDFGSLLVYHQSHSAVITIGAADYRVHIPYGVISAEGAWVKGLVEKPSQRFLCNAGIYSLEPRALDMIPAGGTCDMTDLIQRCLDAGHPVSVFPIHEYWSDIGTPDDLDKARAVFTNMTKRHD